MMYDLRDILPEGELGFLGENVAMQCTRHKGPRGDYEYICGHLGASHLVDAARFGSRTHRLRNIWSNMAPHAPVAAQFAATERPPNLWA